MIARGGLPEGMLLSGALQSLGRQHVCSVSTQQTVPNTLAVRHRDKPSMLFGCQRSMCTEHGLGLDNAPDVLSCIVVEAVEVENASVVVVDVAHLGVQNS